MKQTKKILSVLLCAVLLSSFGVFAIQAAGKGSIPSDVAPEIAAKQEELYALYLTADEFLTTAGFHNPRNDKLLVNYHMYRVEVLYHLLTNTIRKLPQLANSESWRGLSVDDYDAAIEELQATLDAAMENPNFIQKIMNRINLFFSLFLSLFLAG